MSISGMVQIPTNTRKPLKNTYAANTKKSGEEQTTILKNALFPCKPASTPEGNARTTGWDINPNNHAIPTRTPRGEAFYFRANPDHLNLPWP